METPRKYLTAGAFRKALEERLKKTSQTEQIDLNRLRRHVSFDRLLARLFHAENFSLGFEGRPCFGTAVQGRTINRARSRILSLSRRPALAAEKSLLGHNPVP